MISFIIDLHKGQSSPVWVEVAKIGWTWYLAQCLLPTGKLHGNTFFRGSSSSVGVQKWSRSKQKDWASSWSRLIGLSVNEPWADCCSSLAEEMQHESLAGGLFHECSALLPSKKCHEDQNPSSFFLSLFFLLLYVPSARIDYGSSIHLSTADVTQASVSSLNAQQWMSEVIEQSNHKCTRQQQNRPITCQYFGHFTGKHIVWSLTSLRRKKKQIRECMNALCWETNTSILSHDHWRSENSTAKKKMKRASKIVQWTDWEQMQRKR